ncbi:MAG TPA: glycoside hydrolase family 20 zincin-like fold domain-containing protein [Flavitalea sp.]|nr:glycoside hydrolase family 20 zincin-like fold domain-containing protein [Flavitalea sp.]
MRFFFCQKLLFLALCGCFFSSCKNKSQTLERKIENSLTDSSRKEWVDHFSFPAWTSSKDSGLQTEPIDDKIAITFQRSVIPLPKLIRFESRVTIPVANIKLRLRSGASDVEQFASEELATLIRKKTGDKLTDGSFEILIGICDEQGKVDGVYISGAEKLSGLKNKDQAYVISPLSNSGLAIVGLTGKGVYYGVKTLQQLIKPGLSTSFAVVPILYVLDWPDLAERGLWGGWESDHKLMMKNIEFMSNRKMNLMESSGVGKYLTFDEHGRGEVKIDSGGRNQARLHAMNNVLIVTHLDIFGIITQIYKHYPQAKGKGKAAVSDDLVVPCASSPQFVKVLSEWLESAAAQGITDINMWLTEHGDIHCECEQCKNSSQYVLEAKACAKAWQIAHEKYPGLIVRILLTQGSYHVNDQILAAVPPEVKIVFYSGEWDNGTYTALRQPIIYPLLTDFVKKGHWLGTYPTLSASFTYILPWSGANFIKYRMTELVDKNVPSFTGYVAYSDNNNNFYDYNMAAAAEWSWNVQGRDEHEFAATWATQEGISDPETFADWSVMMSPVSWDVYGSQVPHLWWFSAKTKDMIRKREKPTLGKDMFQYFPTLKHLENDLATTARALRLAENLDDKRVVFETQSIQGYLKMLKGIYTVANMTAGKKELDKSQIQALQAAFKDLQNSERETADAMNAWYHAIDPDFKITLSNAIVVIHQVVSDIGVSLKPFGIKK